MMFVNVLDNIHIEVTSCKRALSIVLFSLLSYIAIILINCCVISKIYKDMI